MSNTQYSWARGRAENNIPALTLIAVDTNGALDTNDSQGGGILGTTSNADIQGYYDATGNSDGGPAYIFTIDNRWPAIQTVFAQLERASAAGVTAKTTNTTLVVDSISGNTVKIYANEFTTGAPNTNVASALITGDKIHLFINCYETLVN